MIEEGDTSPRIGYSEDGRLTDNEEQQEDAEWEKAGVENKAQGGGPFRHPKEVGTKGGRTRMHQPGGATGPKRDHPKAP